MKLSFSTKGWHNSSFDDFCDIAKELKFQGIELHNIHNRLFTDKDGAFHDYAAAKTVRKLYEKKLSIPCIDTICNLADKNNETETIAEIEKCIEIASNLHIPYVRVKAFGEENYDYVKAIIAKILPMAEQNGIVILAETSGIFANTKKLCELLDSFAHDNFAALWDMYATYFVAEEEPETTIKNLGAYVKHVHIKDATKTDNGFEFCLIGEGEMPTGEMISALRSVNFDGFISLEWTPDWCEELDDMEIIFSHFVNFMRQWGDTSKNDSLYYNRAHTGRYVWEKDRLIDCTFSQVLDRMVEEFPDQYAFKYTTLDYTRTYSEFRDDVDTFARSLIALGVKAGTHVAVWATNVPQWYIAFWATVKLGAVLVTVNTAYKIHEIEYLLRQSDTHTIIMTEGAKDCHYGEIIAELCPELENTKPGKPLHSKRLPFLRNAITVGFKQKGCLTWNDAIDLSSQVSLSEVYRMASQVDKDDVCNMQYTSGTTGFPKGVMLTHRNIVNNGKTIGDRMDLSTADRMMIQVPMFHCFGMVLSMTSMMTHGGTLCPIPYFSPKSSLACVNDEKITCFNGVPTMFIAMFSHPDFAKTDFSYMRTGIMAGANCPADLMRRASVEMNMREIISVYGQTEASPGCTMGEVNEDLDHRVETVGSAFPGVECKIIDPETGDELPDGESGEFVARGFNIMKGYYKMAEATAQAIDKDGWLHSGDICMRTADGYYKVTGRLKDMIIRGGENLYPREIEEFYLTNPKVKDIQVVGVPDERYGEECCAWIILHQGETSSEEEMKEYGNASIARHKVPRYFMFVKEFPMNAAGKILKYKMREESAEKLGLKK